MRVKELNWWIFFERYLWLVFTLLSYFLFVFMLVRFFIISPGRVDGPSMEPNFIDEQLFFVNRLSYLFSTPKRYDVVQVIDPGSNKLYIKRIVGMPGEIIVIKRGKVFIQKDLRSEPVELDEFPYLSTKVYTKTVGQTRAMRYLVTDNEYFIIGDNRERSVDSRLYGAVQRSNIIGRVITDGSK